MRGSVKQIEWAQEIEAGIRNHWAELEAKHRNEYDDPEGADQIAAEFEAVMQAAAPYRDSAAWWIEEGKQMTRGGVRHIMHRINTYPGTLTRYL